MSVPLVDRAICGPDSSDTRSAPYGQTHICFPRSGLRFLYRLPALTTASAKPPFRTTSAKSGENLGSPTNFFGGLTDASRAANSAAGRTRVRAQTLPVYRQALGDRRAIKKPDCREWWQSGGGYGSLAYLPSVAALALRCRRLVQRIGKLAQHLG